MDRSIGAHALETLTSQYRINDQNLALRKALLRFTEKDIAVLRSLAAWGQRVAPAIAREFYDHQFQHPGTRTFFESFAAKSNLPIKQIREHLEQAQTGYFRQIFEEAAQGGRFGTEYFERRLKVGRLHNQIDLPLKWYVGSYGVYQDLVRTYLKRSFLMRPGLREKAERAIFTVFNYDIQAIMDAFFFDYLATAGVDLEQIEVGRAEHDLSEHGSEMKAVLVGTLKEAARTSRQVARVSTQLSDAVGQVSQAVQQVAAAMQNVASGAVETSRAALTSSQAVDELTQVINSIAVGTADQARQADAAVSTADEMATSVQQVVANADRVSSVSDQARTSAERGGTAVRDTVTAMAEIKTVVGEAADTIVALGRLGEKIGAVVETIDDIAEQTNLLALNAAIEAARAGEHGRGFAVVADEVRKLAERSQRETRAITELIRDVQTGTEQAVRAMAAGSQRIEHGSTTSNQAGLALGEILGSVDSTASQVVSITASAGQMDSGARRMMAAVHAISRVVQSSSAATEQMAAQASQVASSVQSIAAVAEENSAATEEVSAAAEEMMAQVEEITAQADELAQIAEGLETVVSRLKLDLEDDLEPQPAKHRNPARQPRRLTRVV